jgi:polyisoprenoid-binding protein YceI
MKWQIDPAHTNVTVAVKHMAISTVRGRFTSGAEGSIEYDPQAPEIARVELRIKAASIDTGDAKRDGHLRSPDFLDAEKYPEITFKSTTIERKGNNDWLARGNLTIRDVTKPVEVKVETLGVVDDPYVKQRVGFDATARFDRREWGLVWNMSVPSGLLVGEQVKIEFSVEAIPEQTPAAA